MKKLAILFLLCAAPAKAAYFSVVGRPGYVRQVLQEACFQPNAKLGDTSACVSIPLVEHSQRDGYVLIPGEDWSPFVIGWAIRPGGNPMILMGANANLLPVIKSGVLYGLNAASEPESFTNMKALLAPPAQSTGPDVTVNVGAKWGLDLSGKAKGYFLLSVGPALTF